MAYRRVKAAKSQRTAGDQAAITTATRGIAPDPQARRLRHRGGYWGGHVTSSQGHPDVARRSSRQRGQPEHLIQQAIASRTPPARTPSPTVCFYQQEADLPSAGSSLKPRCANSTRSAKHGLTAVGRDELARKPDSVPRRHSQANRRHGDHPSDTVTAPERPTPQAGRATSSVAQCTLGAAFWPCFGWGLPSHPGHPECWCSTAPFSPCHHEDGGLFQAPPSHPRLPRNHPAL